MPGLNDLMAMGARQRLAVLLAGAERLPHEVVAHFVVRTWVVLPAPDRTCDLGEWRRLFAFAGFTVDGTAVERPSGPALLYRGAPEYRARAWSWTTSRSVAVKFASQDGRRSARGRLWVAVVPPDAMLAYWTGRGEEEVVVDTDRLHGPVLPLSP